MTSPRPFTTRMTFEEYLAAEERSEVRHEYVDGQRYAMSGGTSHHHLIAMNVAFELRGRTPGSGCRVYSQGFKVQTPNKNAYYPDVMVTCGPPPDGEALFVRDACLLVEVTSKSTRRTDHVEKRLNYAELAGLHAYWLVETRWRGVLRYWRDEGGAWQMEEVTGDGTLPVPCPAGAAPMTLDAVYAEVSVPREPPRIRRVRERPPAYVARHDALGV